MKTKKIGAFFMVVGGILLAMAVCLVIYNYCDEVRASDRAKEALEEIRLLTAGGVKDADTTAQDVSQATEPDPSAEQERDDGEATPESKETDGAVEIPEYLRNPEMEMPVAEINGQEFIGVIEIPILGMSLPVISEWSYPLLKTAPCRYAGSAYLNNLIIMGHNYRSHFGPLTNIHIGDKVYFTDMAENVFVYEVVDLEILNGTDVEGMNAGEWDLTLFTCTLSGQTRITVRCELLQG